MPNILFVCHGNICRSPMAEIIFRHMLEERGLTEEFQVDSAAVSAEELGNPIYPEARDTLRQHGLNPGNHRAWQLQRGDYDRFDFFLCMDMSNLSRLRMIFGGDPKCKCALLLAYTNRPREMEDPWYTGRFERVYQEICEGCEGFLQKLIGS